MTAKTLEPRQMPSGNVLRVTSTPFGKWLTVETRLLQLPSSQGEIEAHVVVFPEIALVVGEYRSSVILVRQFRFPPLDWILELPAGRVETGEDPADTAVRELSEESGFDCGGVEKIGELRIAPHLSSEVTHVYRASRLRPGPPHPEKGELVETALVPRTQVRNMIAEGHITDSKTISALVLANLI